MAKYSKNALLGRTRAVEAVTFEDQQLTRFGGLAVIQDFFARIDLKQRLRDALAGLGGGGCYGYPRLILTLIVHHLLGFRELRERDDYGDDPMVLRTLGLARVPSVSTLSRLGKAPKEMIDRLRCFLADRVIDTAAAHKLRRVTLDFDGSVQSTRRRAEASAVGYNTKRKGERSYFPLLCTVGQLGMVFDILHRPGNVHDSNGARDFIRDSVNRICNGLERIQLEARLDTAFCSPDILETLDRLKVAFTVTMHFARSPGLKAIVENRKKWTRLDRERDYFELAKDHRPKSWAKPFRVIVIRQRLYRRQRGPLQLDLFEPASFDYTYKAIVTNCDHRPRKVLEFHEGRGEQEAIIGELKQHAGLDYVPGKRLVANQIFLLTGAIAHNLSRELQTKLGPKSAKDCDNRAPRWRFWELSTLRRLLLWHPGRLIRPQGKLTLALANNEALRQRFEHFRAVLTPS